MDNTTQQQLADAAANLVRLRSWVRDLYPLTLEYESAVFNALGSTKENGDWRNFGVNSLINIAIAMASGAAIATGNPAAVPAFACLSAFLHDWGFGKDRPNDLEDTFAVFQIGHEKMQYEIEQKLSHLVDPANNYKNLTVAWKDHIRFMNHNYTVADLAASNFPGLGDAYNALMSAARINFQKRLWNWVIMKTCSYYGYYQYGLVLPKHEGTFQSVSKWAQAHLYKSNPGVFLRYNYVDTDETTNTFDLKWWNLGIGGYEFPHAACQQLFMDDTPDHIINPDGLFNRRYVFEQFTRRKPDFGDYRDLSNGERAPAYNFTGGYFPEETEKTTHLRIIPEASIPEASIPEARKTSLEDFIWP